MMTSNSTLFSDMAHLLEALTGASLALTPPPEVKVRVSPCMVTEDSSHQAQLMVITEKL